MWQCSQQHENKEEAKFCSKCGEKRVVQVYCTECGTLLEQDDLFCTSCGHQRDTQPQVMAKPAPVTPVVQAPIVSTPVVLPTPVVPAQVVQSVVSPAQTVPPTALPQESIAEEPVSFRFGGALIPMGAEPQKQQQTARPMAGSVPPSAGIGGMSSVQSAILGFVAILVVLGLVFYLVGR